MINRIIELSSKNKFMVLLLAACAVAVGVWAMKNIPLDALPDLSDTQVIVYSRWDRSPDIMEDQVTYPIVTAMLGAPKVKDIRGFSDSKHLSIPPTLETAAILMVGGSHRGITGLIKGRSF